MNDRFALIEDHLRKLVEQGYLAAGLARIEPGGAEEAVMMGRASPAGPAISDPTLRLRVASLTKIATGHAIASLATDGVIDLNSPTGLAGVGDVSLQELLSHTSGLTDDGGYIVDPGADLGALLERAPQRNRGSFRYCNLGILAAAAAVEQQTGLRFDHLLSARVFQPAGIEGGVNWLDVSPRARSHRLSLYQLRNGTHHQMVDERVDPTAELVWTDGRPISLMGYRLGQDTGLLSPHGGLRCSVVELARLARLIGSDRSAARLQRQAVWRFDGSNGADCDGLFQAYGLGLTIYEDHAAIPGPLIGHSGSALGLQGGAWFNQDTKEAWGYVLTGAPAPPDAGEDESFFGDEELAIMTQL